MTGTVFMQTFAVAAPFWALTILLGPLGLAAHLVVRTRWGRPTAVPRPEPHRLG